MDSALFEEFKRSWLTSLIGFILIGAGTCLIFWNEGRAVQTTYSLDEALNSVVSLNPYEKVQRQYEGRLVHISGDLQIDEPLTAPEYGVAVQAVKLKRRVQMYQWVEETIEHKFGDTVGSQTETSYSYTTEWRDKLIDSSRFYIRHGHHNPTEMPLKSHVFIAPVVNVGQLLLGADLKNRFTDYLEVTGDERPERSDIKLHLGIYYHCVDVWNPEVGDIRVQFYFAGHQNERYTIVAQQKDGVLVPYFTSKGHEILLLRPGQLSVSEMFHMEHRDAKWQTWKIRAVGWFMLFASVTCLAHLIRITVCSLPIFCNVLSREVTMSANLAISMSLALIIVSLAWIFHRPVLGTGLIMAAISPIFYCMFGTLGAQNAHNYNRM